MSFSLAFTGTAPQFFSRPEAVFTGSSTAEAWSILESVEPLLARGFAVAGFISYELGYTCVGVTEPARNLDTRALPYVVLGAFAPASNIQTLQRISLQPFIVHDFHADIPGATYRKSLEEIARGITAGDFYQINFSVPFGFRYSGDPSAGFDQLYRETRAPFAAYVHFDDTVLMSLSPELFLRFDGNTLMTKPMKGTAGLHAPDALHSEKNRAEHVMIVDLLRNDLSRVCKHVWVEQLFALERHPTFATMTSTISGELRKTTPFHEVIRALFPCGSITGAPKRAAVDTIAALEASARDAYCGTIGYLLPDGTGEWNVAIRTAQLNTRRRIGRLDLGGGIVADSDPDDEWNELEIKGRFFETAKFTQHDRV